MSNNNAEEIIFKNMRETSEYFNFPYSPKDSKLNDQYLSCYCDWKRISRKFIQVKEIYDTPKEIFIPHRNGYKYNVGDIISSTNSSFKILKQIRLQRIKTVNNNIETIYEKGYLVKCIKDGYEFEVLEYNLSRNYGCPVCSNRKIIKGINDVATTHPDIAKLLKNNEDAYSVSYSSGRKLDFKCPRCRYIKKDTFNHINYFGFSCPLCSDGISYPNKFIAKLLTDLNVDFEREKIFDWCKYPCYVDKDKLDYGIYDFVIPEMSIIIEADGELGHGKNTMNTIRHNRRKITPEETLYRDQMKDKLAIQNGYNVIRIDCAYDKIHNRYSNIVNNIKTSKLSMLFDLNKVDLDKIDKYCIEDSYIVDASNMWNEGMTIHEIANKLKISRGTITSYLYIGKKHGLCNYEKSDSILRGYKKSSRRVPYMVIYENKREIFSTITELIEYYDQHYNIKLNKQKIQKYVTSHSSYNDRIFSKISHEDFNYYKNNGLADLVIGEAFSIVA